MVSKKAEQSPKSVLQEAKDRLNSAMDFYLKLPLKEREKQVLKTFLAGAMVSRDMDGFRKKASDIKKLLVELDPGKFQRLADENLSVSLILAQAPREE